MKKESKVWFKVRLGLIVLSFLGGLVPFPGTDEPILTGSDGIFLLFTVVGFLIVLLFVPLMVAGVIAFQAINPLSDESWDRPSHYSNPFRIGNPLPFFHFGAFFIIAGGIGMILGSAIGGLEQFFTGLFVTFAGIGCLGGVHLAMRLCRSRVHDQKKILNKTVDSTE